MQYTNSCSSGCLRCFPFDTLHLIFFYRPRPFLQLCFACCQSICSAATMVSCLMLGHSTVGFHGHTCRGISPGRHPRGGDRRCPRRWNQENCRQGGQATVSGRLYPYLFSVREKDVFHATNSQPQPLIVQIPACVIKILPLRTDSISPQLASFSNANTRVVNAVTILSLARTCIYVFRTTIIQGIGSHLGQLMS